jgi:hypothetical protein
MNTQVVTGTLQDWNTVEDKEGNQWPFVTTQNRAMWAWLRFNMGFKEADAAIKENEHGCKASSLQRTLDAEAPSLFGKKELQFIIVGGDLRTVASTEHLIVPPERVTEIALGIKPDLRSEKGFGGLLSPLEELPGLKVQFQFDPGDIFTMRAIGVGFGVRVITCTNPLSFLGAGSLNGLMGPAGSRDMGGLYEKILRFRNEDELEGKIQRAIEGIGPKAELLKEQIQYAKVHPLTEGQADTLLTAFPAAYNAGQDTVKQIKNRYAKEDKTLWGAAQATSYVAAHREAKRASEKLDRNLASAGAAMIFVKDVQETNDRCLNWLENVRKLDLNDWR